MDEVAINNSNPQFIYHEATKHESLYQDLLKTGVKLDKEIVYTFSKDYPAMVRKNNVEMIEHLMRKTSENLCIADIGVYFKGVSETNDALVKNADIVVFCFAPSQRGYITILNYLKDPGNKDLLNKTIFVCTKYESQILNKRDICLTLKGLVNPEKVFTFSRIPTLEKTSLKGLTITPKGEFVTKSLPVHIIMAEAIKGQFELAPIRRELDSVLDYLFNPPLFRGKYTKYVPLITAGKEEKLNGPTS